MTDTSEKKVALLARYMPDINQGTECINQEISSTCNRYARYVAEEESCSAKIELFALYDDRHQPTIEKIVHEAQNDTLDILIIYSIKELRIPLREFVNFMYELEKKNVIIYSATENVDNTTSLGKLQMHTLSIRGEFEHAHADAMLKQIHTISNNLEKMKETLATRNEILRNLNHNGNRN